MNDNLKRNGMRNISLALCVCILLPYSVRADQIQDKLDDAGKKIDQLEDNLDKTQESITAYEQEQQVLQADILDRQEAISALSAELDNTKAALLEKEEQIEKTQEALSKSKAESRSQYEQMKKRIQFMYENDVTDMLVYILEAGSIADLLRRAEYFQSMIEYDREKLDEYRATVKKIKQEKQQLVLQQEELTALKDVQTKQLAQIDAALTELKDRLKDKTAQIQASKEQQEIYVKELERQKAYEAELERQKAEEDRRRQEEIKRQEEELARKKEEQQRKKQQEQEQKKQEQQQKNNFSSSTSVWYDDNSAVQAGSDLELLSTIIYCEAGSEPYEGQLAVGSVVMNRVASSSFPNSISGVIYQSGQFSPVASGRFAQALAAGYGSRCKAAAQEVLNGKRNVECLYFRTNNGLIDGIVIGNHVFY